MHLLLHADSTASKMPGLGVGVGVGGGLLPALLFGGEFLGHQPINSLIDKHPRQAGQQHHRQQYQELGILRYPLALCNLWILWI
eukprot:758964-Pelagomonas_calceolata.AAC.1